MTIARLAGLNLNLLLVLDALLADRNTTRVAARLGVAQSAVSRALGRLRAHFDDPLFVRAPHGLVPTPRAEALKVPLRAALDGLGAVVGEAAAWRPTKSDRRFRLSSVDLAELVLLPKLVARLAAEAPSAGLLVESPRPDTLERLAAGELDVGVGRYGEAPASFCRRKLFDDDFVCVVRRDHPEVKGELDLATFLRLSHLLIAPRASETGFVDQRLGAMGERRRIALVVPHFLVAPLVVAETDLVLTLPSRVARRLAGAALQILPVPLDVAPFTIVALWHERADADPAHRWFRELLWRVAGGLDAR